MKELIEPFKRIWHFLLVNIIVACVFCMFTFDEMFESPYTFITGTLWCSTIFITQWLGHSYIQTQIAKRYTWLNHTFQRLTYTIVSVIFYAIGAFWLVQVLMNLIVFGTIPSYLYEFNVNYISYPVIVAFLISLFAATYGFFKSWKDSIVAQEKLKREMLTYKYEALRNQINPHFMFNSLNVLSDLVYDDQRLAVKFIHQFSDIYRYVLDSREKELVPLSEEVAFIEKFIFLLKTRFEDKLSVNFDVPVETNDLIVPLSLQLVIENAVKHNEVSKANPLNITVKRVKNTLVITNPIQLKNTGDQSKKIGLKNLAQQFAYFTDEKLEISNENGIFKIVLPLLTQA